MNKMELITAMAEKFGLSKKDCETALNALTETVTAALRGGEKVQLFPLQFDFLRLQL